MEIVVYAGMRLTASEVGTAVASAISGRVPTPPKGRPTTTEPAVWLAGLLDAVAGGPLAPVVERALQTAARTGNARALEILGQLLGQREALDDATVLEVLDRPQVWWSDATARAFAALVARRVLAGRIPWDPALRRFVLEPRLHGFMLPVSVRWDTDWLVDHLDEILARLPDRVAAGLSTALEDLEEAERAALRLRLLARLPELPEAEAGALARALGVEVAETRVAEPEAVIEPAPAIEAVIEAPAAPPTTGPARLDVRALPWRADDGRWFLIPEDAQVLPGRVVLRRGWHVRRVDPWLIKAWEITAQQALALRGQQVASLWALGRALVGAKEPTGELLTDAAAREAAAKQLRAARARLRVALGALGEE